MAAGGFAGIALHAVVAEPGGDDEILARLAVRDVKDLGFPVHSDPEHKLLLKALLKPRLYVKEPQKCSTSDSKTSVPYEDYMMVQPALVVFRRSGEVQQVWSWMTDPLKDVEPKKWNTVVPELGPLVGVRPISSDIAPSIKENRSVKLQCVFKPVSVKNV